MRYFRAVFYSLVTLGMYLGICLLGWGLDDLSGFFSHPARIAFAIIMALFSIAIGLQAVEAPEGISGSKGETSKLLRRQTIIGTIMVLFLFAAMFLLPFADRRSMGTLPETAILRWAGVGLTGIGFILIFWSGVALGKMYSAEVTIQKDHHLINTGLYHHIRHPRYLGILITTLGMPLLFSSWAGLIVVPLMLAVLLFRIHDEEQVLHREFGAEWVKYCQHSWRLIPRIY
jgi:protein-S-isoprenylcysteine O-methyltransferase Ste14